MSWVSGCIICSGARAKINNRYKGLGASVVDKDGTPDNNEQYWISCGDIEGVGKHSRAIYNDVIKGKNAQLKEFIDLGKAVTDRFLEVFSAVLAIPPESEDYLTKQYSHTNNCGSHVRLLKCPPKPKDAKVSLQPQYVSSPLCNSALFDENRGSGACQKPQGLNGKW